MKFINISSSHFKLDREISAGQRSIMFFSNNFETI